MGRGPGFVPARRGARFRPRLAGGPPARYGRAAEPSMSRGVDAPRGDRGPDRADPPRRPGDEQHLPPPGPAGEGGGHRRSHQSRPADPGPGSRLARGRAPAVRDRAPAARRAGGSTRGGRPDHRLPDGVGADHLRWPLLPPRRRASGTETTPAAAHPAADRGSHRPDDVCRKFVADSRDTRPPRSPVPPPTG